MSIRLYTPLDGGEKRWDSRQGNGVDVPLSNAAKNVKVTSLCPPNLCTRQGNNLENMRMAPIKMDAECYEATLPIVHQRTYGRGVIIGTAWSQPFSGNDGADGGY